jgi:hypothetical protein
VYEGELQCMQRFVMVVSGLLSLLLVQRPIAAGMALMCLISSALASRAMVVGVLMTCVTVMVHSHVHILRLMSSMALFCGLVLTSLICAMRIVAASSLVS